MFNYKKIFFFHLFAFVFVCKSSAQFPNPLNFNTATNATNTGTLAVGSNDLHWTSAHTNSLGPYVPAVVCGNQAPCCWINSPFVNANWITYPHTCSASPAEHSCLGNVDEFYLITLNLPALACNQSITTPSAYCLSLDFYADNWVSEVYVNNVLSFNNPNGNPYNATGFLFPLTVSLCNNWQVGTNTIIVHVKSGAPSFPGWTGFLAQANQTVNPNIGNPLSATISQTIIPCGIASASVHALGGGGGYTYTWIPTGGNSALASNLSTGNYSVIVNSINGCTTTQTVNIVVGPSYTLTSSPNVTVCSGSAITLTASGATTYTWLPGPLYTAAVTVTPLATTVYTVTGNNANCIKTNTVMITTIPLPTINILASTGTLCSGSLSSATLTASGANTYTWLPGNLIGNSIVVSPTVTTTYSVTGTSASGCNKTNTFVVNVVTSPTVTAVSTSPTLCLGNSVTLTANGANAYTWNPVAINATSVVVTPTINTTYTLIGSNGICSNSTTILISVIANPTLIANAAPSNICTGQNSTLSVSGALNYTWQPMNVLGNNVVVSPTVNTNYTVTGSSASGCLNTTSLLVSVIITPTVTLITSSPTLCAGSSATLTSFGAPSYTYYPGAIVANPLIVTPNITTTYTVYGANGNCGDLKQITLTVMPNETITAVCASPNICLGKSTNLIASGGTSYVWSPGSITGNMIVVSPVVSTTYTLQSINLCSNIFTLNVNIVPAPSITISGNVGICVGGTNTLIAMGANTYTWNTGSNNSSIITSPNSTSNYTVTGTDLNTGCVSSVEAMVIVSSYPLITVSGDSVCFGRSLTLEAFGATTYTWSTGNQGNIISVSPTINTTYAVTGSGTLPFCTSTETINVNVLPAPTLTLTLFPGDNICKGKSINLSALGADAYVWSTGSGTNNITVSPASTTVYSVTGTTFSLSCKATKTISVKVNPLPDIKIGSDSLACEGDIAILKAKGANIYMWSDAQTSSSITIVIKESDKYYVTGTDLSTGCSSTGSIEIIPSSTCCEFWIANSFTPNEDGLNEMFGPKTLCKFTRYKFMIFDRWGEKIFETNDPKKYWDGALKGKPCKNDVYVYLIDAEKSGTGFSEKEKYLNLTGHVTLIR